jgi:hypothetical protein
MLLSISTVPAAFFATDSMCSFVASVLTLPRNITFRPASFTSMSSAASEGSFCSAVRMLDTALLVAIRGFAVSRPVGVNWSSGFVVGDVTVSVAPVARVESGVALAVADGFDEGDVTLEEVDGEVALEEVASAFGEVVDKLELELGDAG